MRHLLWTRPTLIGHLDDAGIKRAAVLSTAHIFAQRWLFEPAIRQARPVAVLVTVEPSFRLKD